jgi:indole-3-glycerol phosphate synthase
MIKMTMTTQETQTELDIIIKAKRQLLAKRQERTPTPAVIALAEMRERPAPILNVVTDGSRVLLIGRVSLDETYDPVAAALRCVRDGADAIAFFTDMRVYSKGMDDLLLVARGIPSTSVVCQNYILNEYHVTEARAAGAAAIVAHSTVLDKAALRQVVSLAHRLKMTSIVQVSHEEELDYTTALSPHVIGFGDGNSTEFDAERDIPMIEHLNPQVPFHCRTMALGCMHNLDDVAAAVELGMDAVIVDEALIASETTYEQLRALLERPPKW